MPKFPSNPLFLPGLWKHITSHYPRNRQDIAKHVRVWQKSQAVLQRTWYFTPWIHSLFRSLHAGASGGISVTLFFVVLFSLFRFINKGEKIKYILHKIWRFRIRDKNEKRFSIYLTKNETYFSKHAIASMPRERYLSLEKWIAQLFISKKLWGNFSRPKPQSIPGLHKHMLQVF